MELIEKFDIIESFVAGLGNKNKVDINNAVFIAREILNLDLPLEFRGSGRLGVESLELYGILESIEPKQKSQEAFQAGKMLSDYNSRELRLVASYLWNEGKSSLNKNERKEAFILLQERFGATEKEQVPRPFATVASA